MTATNSAIENNRVAICIIVNDDCNESFTCEWNLPDEIGEVEVGSILEVETNLGTAEVLFLMEKNSHSDTQRKKVLKKTCKNQDHWCWSKSLVEKFRDEVSLGESPIEEYPWLADETFVADCTVRNSVRLAYCVHFDEPNEYISKIYSWEMPDGMRAPKFGDTLIVENLNGVANVVFLFEREVIPIKPLGRKKVLGISNLEIPLYMEEYHLLFEISNEILRGTHTPDDFLGIEDGEIIGWRIPAEEQDVVPARRARRFRSARFKELKERIIAQIPNPEPKGVNESCAIKRLRKSANLIELMREVYEDFLMLAEMNIITSKIMCDFRGLFKAHNIFYNEDADHGRIYLDSGRDYEAHRKAQVYVCGDACMQAFGTVRVFATGQSRVEAWEKSEVTSEGCARVIAYRESTVEARGGEVYAYFDSSVTATRGIIRAYDSSKICAKGPAVVWANEQSTVRACGGADIVARDKVRVVVVGDASVSSWDNTFVLVEDDRATVTAGGNSCVVSTCNIACKLKGNAIYHNTESNTLQVNSRVKIEVNQPED